jgi:hypothetical protein
VLWRLDIAGGTIVRREIAGNDPPTDPFRASLALDGPNRGASGDVPCRPLADAAVLDALRAKICGDVIPLFAAPRFIGIRTGGDGFDHAFY